MLVSTPSRCKMSKSPCGPCDASFCQKPQQLAWRIAASAAEDSLAGTLGQSRQGALPAAETGLGAIGSWSEKK